MALERDPEYTKKLMMTYPDRFIFARDGFNNNLSEFVDPLGLPQNIPENFYRGNIQRLIGKYFPSPDMRHPGGICPPGFFCPARQEFPFKMREIFAFPLYGRRNLLYNRASNLREVRLCVA